LWLAASVQQQRGGGTVGVESFDGGYGIADFIDFDGRGVADAFHVVVEEGSKFGAAGFSEED
jgi:hypothetical protein